MYDDRHYDVFSISVGRECIVDENVIELTNETRSWQLKSKKCYISSVNTTGKAWMQSSTYVFCRMNPAEQS